MAGCGSILPWGELAYCAQHYGALARGLGGERQLQARWLGLASVVALAERLDLGEPVTRQDDLADWVSESRKASLAELTLADLVEGGEGARKATETGRAGNSGDAAGAAADQQEAPVDPRPARIAKKLFGILVGRH